MKKVFAASTVMLWVLGCAPTGVATLDNSVSPPFATGCTAANQNVCAYNCDNSDDIHVQCYDSSQKCGGALLTSTGTTCPDVKNWNNVGLVSSDFGCTASNKVCAYACSSDINKILLTCTYSVYGSSTCPQLADKYCKELDSSASWSAPSE